MVGRPLPPRRSRKGTGSSTGSHRPRGDESSEPSVPSGGTYFLGRYRVVDEIGVGGMASVHLARMDGPGGFQKWVAIKRIHRHLIEDDQFIKMFLDEARIAARISHPNVAQVFDLGKHKDTYWIAMEYLHGEPLREVIRSVDDGDAPPMTYCLAAKIVADAAEGLHSAHELTDKNGKSLNLVHRDVTPHNLFLTYDGAVKVVDFGIAKVAGRLSNTRAGMLKGKIAYMSPEQVRGLAIDRRTDVFALGVVLWELTTQQRLFRKDTDLETLERVQACVVPPPSSVKDDYPGSLETIVMRALARDPAKRYATARDMSRALQKYLMDTGQFVGPEEIGGYVKTTLHDRFEKREAHLQWAAEVTQTINATDVTGAGNALEEIEEVSALTYSSDIKPVAQRQPVSHTPSRSRARAAAPRPPRASETPSGLPRASNDHLPPAPRPAAGMPAREDPRSVRASNLPSFETTGSNTESAEILEIEEPTRAVVPGRGAPRAAAPARSFPAPGRTVPGPVPRTLPGPPARPAAPPRSAPPPDDMGFHDYGDDEDDNAVTTVMAPPSESEETAELLTANSISAVPHVPAKPARLAPVPDEKVVLAPSLVGSQEAPAPAPPRPPTPAAPVRVEAPVGPVAPTAEAPQAFAPGGIPGPPQGELVSLHQASPVERRDMRTVLIALIAAATTLIALGLSALVILKITEKPTPPTRSTVATVARPTAGAAKPEPRPAATATAAPTAARAAADPDSLPEQGVDPSEIPADRKPSAPAAPAPAPKRAAGTRPKLVAPARPASGGPGYLTIVCDPFCTSVVAAGRNLGPSPVVRRALPPGSHGVVLRSKGGITKSIGVTIKSGKTTARRVKMK